LSCKHIQYSLFSPGTIVWNKPDQTKNYHIFIYPLLRQINLLIRLILVLHIGEIKFTYSNTITVNKKEGKNVEGSTKNGYASYRSTDTFYKIKQAARYHFKRVKNLTPKKVYTHFIDFLYKDASLLVIYKELKTQPELQQSKINIQCRLLDSSYTKEISGLSNLAMEKIEEYFQDGGKCLGAFYNEQMVAYSWCHYKDRYFPFFNYSIEVKGRVYIGPDYVTPEFRGNKIHCYLLTKMLDILYKEGCRYVLSSVLQSNHASKKGLASAGFLPQKKVHVKRVFKTMVCKNIEQIDRWDIQ
jgi:hypothetical protein